MVLKHTTQKIAKAFGSFYSQLGESVANKIKMGSNNMDYYLNRIPHNLKSMVMKPTSQREIKKLIKDLPNKTSHGHDMISNELLKSLNISITYPLFIIFNQLFIIFNQSLSEGVFPNLKKMAEIIPL